jgi:hypothetical protein
VCGSECGDPLTGNQRVICGKSRCRDARCRRLHPKSYAKRERQKVERRRQRRRLIARLHAEQGEDDENAEAE